MNSNNGGRKVEGGESKKEKRKRQEKWGAKIRPPTLKPTKFLSQLPKKKKKKISSKKNHEEEKGCINFHEIFFGAD